MTSTTPASTPFRVVRAAVFGAVSVVLSVGAHAYAGGSTTTETVFVAFALSFVVACALAGRERSAKVIFPALAGCQALLHVLFAVAHSAGPMPAGHHHMTLLPSLSMLVTHAWAAGLTALWLSRGEALLWGLLRRMAVRLLVLLRVAVEPAHPLIVPVVADRVVVLSSALTGHAISRRGPPGNVNPAAA
ncbi:hypothetical protein [Herbidospora daliensis]|uniref:hypothetical protein n=1 Tax=Herbidospora daliensis TaxID=295585 RepID=UPI00078132D6|nr:hypothetical protein [Herbidospora daliensis]